ncbi:FAD-binding oxidoreductase [Pseudooceanicola sediminis]|uniref:FAD-binding oxidoreductase n=1 Tax=Pseudooceanicola sediminis TaxID=2211117 RepID=A0A399J5N3_9RHOB|nr:FAD-binding oxidoreductase [Pseudooceanicola sediminis]KAA2316349.1 FAD-binding oxidoreductase [Puniceibacterium sp. HSS470]RII39262.1 FAD-binding oxidoreductase [Pseudooceanicola sediminis]|tara:strand:- start:5704 stop:7041 length:1338 start_codon:yes stop_codon:yes gene_type:complete
MSGRRKLAGWGRYPVLDARLYQPRDVADVQDLVQRQPGLIARGNGRAYGDSAVNADSTIDMRLLNRMLAFDAERGQLVAEAGVLLGDIIAAFLPRGWFPMVTPGTKFVTLGGAIAADVHGKNHHRDGSFRSCVDWIEVMGADGRITRCSADQDPQLFTHTLGGMGLTGIVIRAALRLRPVQTGWIRQVGHPAANLAAAMEIFETSADATYSVAWIDCLGTGSQLGRSLVMLGEHAVPADLSPEAAEDPLRPPAKGKRTVPFDFPRLALNRWTVRAFNALYYRAGVRNAGAQVVDWDSYFYPLDALQRWNRIYGRQGFAQFQCVLPLARSEAGLTALLQAIAQAGAGSFLAVLKRFGAQNSPFSFPMEGYTLALDFPVTSRTLALLDRLDAIAVANGGRFYLAKDSRMSASTLRASDDRAIAFARMRAEQGWDGRFHSHQSERLSL